MDSDLFPGFRTTGIRIGEGVVHARIGGAGPAVLLLHGYPQTHAAWHRIAPALSKRFTVVAADLRGYGESVAAPGAEFTKRAVAAEQAALMAALGYARYAVVGHDRGARVGHRLALDHPEAVSAFASLAVLPLPEAWALVDRRFALHAFHWFLLAQPADLPERLLAADPQGFLDATLIRMAGGLDAFDPQALATYRRAFATPSVRAAICGDYRAAAGPDAALDEAEHAAGRRLNAPTLVLWPQSGVTPPDPHPLEVWHRWAPRVEGSGLPGGHLLPEMAAREVLDALLPFLARHAA